MCAPTQAMTIKVSRQDRQFGKLLEGENWQDLGANKMGRMTEESWMFRRHFRIDGGSVDSPILSRLPTWESNTFLAHRLKNFAALTLSLPQLTQLLFVTSFLSTHKYATIALVFEKRAL